MTVLSQVLVSEKQYLGERSDQMHLKLWLKEMLRYYCLFSALIYSATRDNVAAPAVQMHKDGRGRGARYVR